MHFASVHVYQNAVWRVFATGIKASWETEKLRAAGAESLAWKGLFAVSRPRCIYIYRYIQIANSFAGGDHRGQLLEMFLKLTDAGLGGKRTRDRPEGAEADGRYSECSKLE